MCVSSSSVRKKIYNHLTTQLIQLKKATNERAKISKERQDQYAGKARKYKEALDSLKARTDNQIKDLQEELRRHQEDLASGKLKYENEKRRVEMFQRALKNKIKDFEGQKKRFKNTSSFEGLEKYAKQLKSLYAETFQWAKQYATL